MKQAMIDEETLAQINGPYVCPRDAGPEWRAACEYGLDMSLVEDALSKTPEERLETHQRTRNLILALKEEANHVSTAADEDLVIRLRTHRVEFALIGDVCGMLHGAPLVTFGLELCC